MFIVCHGTSSTEIALVILRAHGHVYQRQAHPHIGAMHLDLSDEETAALTQELHDIVENVPLLASRPHAEGHTRHAEARARPRTLAAAEGVCSTASRPRQK